MENAQAAKSNEKSTTSRSTNGGKAAQGEEAVETKLNEKTGLPEGMVPVASDLCHYKPDTCSAVALRGFLVDHQQMPPADTGPWSILVVKLTQPSKGEDRDGKVCDLAEGDYVAICMTHTLSPLLQYARLANAVFEIFIQPKAKVKIGGGKTMWTYACGAFPKPQKRLDLGIMPPGATAAPMLGTGGDSEIPF